MQNDFLSALMKLREWYQTGESRPVSFRLHLLKQFKKNILQAQDEIFDALNRDLKKNREESWITEIGLVLSEIKKFEKNLKRWSKPKQVDTNIINFPSSSFIYREPLGVVFIIAPWNYPFQLLMMPFVAAIATGNAVVLKPSEFAPATALVMKKIIHQTFQESQVLYIEGDGASIIPEMIKNFHFDLIFYTGSTVVGKKIYELAATQLTPVVLELGGKSPCIVQKDAHLKVAAKRIVMTKFSNAGQMCVAPDYILVENSIQEILLENMIFYIKEFFGENALENYHYGKIINEKQFDRLTSLLSSGEIVYGGQTIKEKLFIAPTLLKNISLDSQMMQEEIFGPILPVIPFHTKEEAMDIIKRNPNPLALYVFTSSKKDENFWIEHIPFGGGCINNAAWHLTNDALPFGGRGNSGISSYHGEFSFDVFTHKKSILKTPTWFDPKIKYPPFQGKLKWFKKLLS
ncbi:MAG: aldehyde dehydrogenase family protein [Bacteroidetes bacterium]|nr:aldehyde dehydrogenase family protein [Bacteroidota bacterium]